MTYILVRSKRKTCAVYIRDTGVEVRAPLRMPVSEIDRLVSAKTDWITAKLAELVARKEKRAGFSPTYGGTIHYRGSEYPILETDGKKPGFDGTAFLVPPGLQSSEIKNTCIGIYKLCAAETLTGKTRVFAEQMGVSPAAVKVNNAKTRWGSCSAKKNINLSWRLMMADDPVIDYVVVHELAHLKEMNHSSKFWAVVEQTLPDYRQRQKQLRTLQDRLCTEDWDVI